MSAYRVALDELYDAIDRMASFEAKLEDALQQADAQVNRLHVTWTGAAADEQRVVHERWKAGAQEMHAALVVMRQIADTAHANYSSAGEANTRMWAL